MKKFAIIGCVLGLLGITFGAFGAHGARGAISDFHYHAYRVGIEYLFFHLAPLFYIATLPKSKLLDYAGYSFVIGILMFTGSNLLMTTEAIHHVNFHFLWPVTPLGGVFMMIGWAILLGSLLKKTP